MLVQSQLHAGIIAVRAAAAASDPTLTFRGSQTSGASGNPKTFSAMAIGPAAADREVIAVIMGHAFTGSSRNGITGVTIGGVAATLDVGNAGAANSHVTIARALVPTGTTANVVVTADTSSGEIDQWHVATYSIVNRAVVGAAPIDTALLNGGYVTGAPPSINIDVNVTGVIVAGIDHIGSFDDTIWTGATEDYDNTSNPKSSTASFKATVAVANKAIGWSGGSSAVNQTTAAASYS